MRLAGQQELSELTHRASLHTYHCAFGKYAVRHYVSVCIPFSGHIRRLKFVVKLSSFEHIKNRLTHTNNTRPIHDTAQEVMMF